MEAMGDALRLDTVGLPMPVHARGASRAIWGRMVWTKVRVRAAMLQYAYASITISYIMLYGTHNSQSAVRVRCSGARRFRVTVSREVIHFD